MKKLKIFSAFAAAAIASTILSGCADNELYEIDSPDWLQPKIDSIAAVNNGDGGSNANKVIHGSAGNISSGFWAEFSDYYTVKSNQRMNIKITNFKSTYETYFKNWVFVGATTERDGEGYSEYWVVRADAGRWGGADWQWTNNENINVSDVANAENKPFLDDGTFENTKKWILTVDNLSTGSAIITATGYDSEDDNATEVYTYTGVCNTKFSGTITTFFTAENASFDLDITYEDLIELTPTAISIKEGTTPTAVEKYTGEEPASTSYFFGDGEAVVIWSDGSSTSVDSKDLSFTVIPDLSTVGTATVAVAYGKTSMGQFCQPVTTTYQLEVTNPITAIEAKYVGPERTFYYFDADVEISYPSVFEVTAIYSDNTTGNLDAKNVTFTVNKSDGKFVAKYNDITCEVSNTTTAKGKSAIGESDRTSHWQATQFGEVAVGSPVVIKLTMYAAANDYDCALPEITSTVGNWTYCINANNWGFGTEPNPNPLTTTILQNDFFNDDYSHADRLVDLINGLDCIITFTNNGDGSATVEYKGTTLDGVERTLSFKTEGLPETFDCDITMDHAYLILHD